jgi:hypothetical protein
MKISEVFRGFQVFSARVRVKNPGYTNVTEVTVFARDAFMARQLLQNQYGAGSIVSNIQRIA